MDKRIFEHAASIGESLRFYKLLDEDLDFSGEDVNKIVIYFDTPEKSCILRVYEDHIDIESGQTGNSVGLMNSQQDIKIQDRIKRLVQGIKLILEEEINKLKEEGEEL